MTRFDEGMAASAAGESADLRTIGDLYCAATLASEITLDVSRFEQWTAVVMGFMERTGHPDLVTFCGTCCAEILRAGGQWEEGEGWLTRTLSELEKGGQKARCVHPATRLASFRVSQARLKRPKNSCTDRRTSPKPSKRWSPCTWLVGRPPSRPPGCTAA